MNALAETILWLNRWGDAFWNYASAMFTQSSVLILILLGVDLLIRKKVRAIVRFFAAISISVS